MFIGATLGLMIFNVLIWIFEKQRKVLRDRLTIFSTGLPLGHQSDDSHEFPRSNFSRQPLRTLCHQLKGFARVVSHWICSSLHVLCFFWYWKAPYNPPIPLHSLINTVFVSYNILVTCSLSFVVCDKYSY